MSRITAPGNSAADRRGAGLKVPALNLGSLLDAKSWNYQIERGIFSTAHAATPHLLQTKTEGRIDGRVVAPYSAIEWM